MLHCTLYMKSTDQRKTDDIQISILTWNLELKTKQTKPKAFLMVKNNITTHLKLHLQFSVSIPWAEPEGSRINTDDFLQVNERQRHKLLGGSHGTLPWEIVWILTPQSPLSLVSE